MIYIQGADGLKPISSQLTKEKIIAALGFTPADQASFYEDESGALVVTDEKGYIIARIDSEGLTTTKIDASAIALNGEDLAAKLKMLEEKVPEIDMSDYALAEDVAADKVITDAHINNQEIHVTQAERQNWNAKSTFSGIYSDLTDAPNITNDEDALVVCDTAGNVIMRVDEYGLNAAGLYDNGKAFTRPKPLAGLKVSFIGDSISAYNGYIPSGYRPYYPSGNVDAVNKIWWHQVINNTGLSLGVNASYSGSSVQIDGNGPAGCEDARINAVGTNGTPDIIVIFLGANDGEVQDLAQIGEINDVIDLPFTTTSANTYDTHSFVSAYQAMLTKLMIAYPNAKIACCSLLWNGDSEYTTSDDLHRASQKIAELCDLYGCHFIDLRKCGINPANMRTYFMDNTLCHPNVAGHTLIANYVSKQLENII